MQPGDSKVTKCSLPLCFQLSTYIPEHVSSELFFFSSSKGHNGVSKAKGSLWKEMNDTPVLFLLSRYETVYHISVWREWVR
jgi:hypothetical protein